MEVYRQKGSINAVAPVRTREYEKISFCSAVDQLVTGTPSSEMLLVLEAIFPVLPLSRGLTHMERSSCTHLLVKL